MDISNLNADLIDLVEKKNELKALSYDDSRYDSLEEELHDLEDKFVQQYGTYLEEVFSLVHDEYCPDDDVLLPTAYLADHYKVSGENGSRSFEVGPKAGVPVDADDFPAPTHLVMVPGPLRIILQTGKSNEVVWSPLN